MARGAVKIPKNPKPGSVYYRTKFLNPEYKPLDDESRIANSELQAIYTFRKETEKRLAYVVAYNTAIETDVREINADGMIMNVDRNDPIMLEICKIAGPQRGIFAICGVFLQNGYTFTGQQYF